MLAQPQSTVNFVAVYMRNTGVQSNGRHNNTWTPIVNFGQPAEDRKRYPRIGILFVRREYRGVPQPPYTYLSHRKRPFFSIWSFLSSSSAHDRSFTKPLSSDPLSSLSLLPRRPSALIEHKCMPNRLNVRIISITKTEFPPREPSRRNQPSWINDDRVFKGAKITTERNAFSRRARNSSRSFFEFFF